MRFLSLLAISFILFSGKGICQNSCNEWSRFRCSDGICISNAKVCNGYQDCPGGEDERDCVNGIDCRERDMAAVTSNNYTCKGECKWGGICKARNKRCFCDDECGLSCVGQYSTCPATLPVVEYSSGSYILRMNRETHTVMNIPTPSSNYKFMDTVRYVCNKGRRLEGPFPRCTARKIWSNEKPTCVDIVCHDPVPQVPKAESYRFGKRVGGRTVLIRTDEEPEINHIVEYICADGLIRNGDPPRCDENRRWTEHTIKCVVPCYEERNPDVISQYNLQCGQECDTALDCPGGMECHCQIGCSRICVNPNVDCGNATAVANTHLNYTGSGIARVARYKCRDGFYLESGELSMLCSGSGVWTGEPPNCSPVECGDPSRSIRATGGDMYTYQGNRYGDMVEFSCRSNSRMLGSPVRHCMGNGKWSGILTVCDVIDDEERCPHPGQPINGRLIGEDFRFGATVRFECERDYVMYGSPVQTCLWLKEWNGTATPTCQDPRIPHSASDVVSTLTRSLSNLPDTKTSLGRSIQADDINRVHEIYLLFDVSASVLKKKADFAAEFQFAKRLVRRMEGFRGQINYGIMLFASNVTAIDFTDGKSTPDEIIEKLDKLYNKAAGGGYREQTRSGTATSFALKQLKVHMSFMRLNERGNEETAKRHIFIFTDGMHTEGDNPVKDKELIEREFGAVDGHIEFYSITACKTCNAEAQDEVKALSTGADGKNYILIEDFHELSTYLDEVTDLKIDFAKCGQAGEVGSIKKQASLARTIGGDDAAENAWPWQAMITRLSTSMKTSLSNDKLLGGASILNNKWLLTAAHVLEPFGNQVVGHFIVFVGIFERPSTRGNVKKSVKAYSIGGYIPHQQYEVETFVNDIALIKLGNKLNEALHPIEGETGGLTFSYYIRPVCLPCTGTCLKEKHLYRDNKVSLISNDMDSIAKCRVEEKFLHSEDSKAVVTGFGHMNETTAKITRYNINPSKKLQQALLKIEVDERCVDGISNINKKTEANEEDGNILQYTDSMMCCVSGIPNKIVDSCQGDSGGPVVREVRDEQTGESCWVQIGIVSFGHGCGQDYPGYYTKVARFIPWINDTMGGILPGP